MADQKLRFIAEWQDKGLKRGAADASKALDGVDKKTVSAGKSLAVLGSIAAAGAVALKQVYDVTKQGAQLELTATRFDRLAESIGTTGDALRDDLSEAMGGLLSQADQMALATDLMSLGLVKSGDEAVRAAGLVAQLGMDMNQLVLTLTNQTTMRFDALGIKVDGFDDKVQQLKDSGIEASEAFTEAFWQQAEEQLETVGSVADTSAGEIMILESTVKDFMDTLKLMTAEGLVPFIKNFNDLTELRQEGVINFLQQDFLMWANAIGLAEGRTEELIDELERIKHIEEVKEELTEYVYTLEDLAQAGREGIDPIQELADATEDYTIALDDANTALGNFIQKQMDNIFWIENGGLALQEFVDQTLKDYEDGLISAEEANADLRVAGIETIVMTQDMNAMSLDQLEGEFEDLGYDIDVARRLALAVYNGVKSIDGLVANATINIETNGSIPNIVGNQVTGGGGGAFQQAPIPAGIGGPKQAGGDFIVPPQFSNDSGLVRVSAGERVKVDTASNTRQDKLVARNRDRRNNIELANMIADAIIGAGV